MSDIGGAAVAVAVADAIAVAAMMHCPGRRDSDGTALISSRKLSTTLSELEVS